MELRRSITRALDGLGAELGRQCSARGPVVGTVLVDGSGEIVHARIDPGYLGAGACVADHLQGKRVPNGTGKDVLARVAFSVGR